MRRSAVAVAWLVGALGACADDPAPAVPAVSDAAPAPREVTDPAAPDESRGYVGVVFARNRSAMSSNVGGELVSVEVRAGDRVQEGDVIARVDPRETQEELQVARAELSAARAMRDSADVELREAAERLERARKLEGQISAQDLAAAEFAVDRARATRGRASADVERQKRRVTQLRTRRDQTEVRASFAGTVAVRYLDPGAVVAPGEPIVRLIETDELWVRFAVPAENAPSLSVGDEVSVAIDTLASPVTAVVQQVAPEIDPISQMVLIEASLPNDGTTAIRSGLAAWVKP